LFVLLWPVCDDHGRTRGAPRFLANVLFPYDEDARGLVEGWLNELEAVGAIRRYVVDGCAYVDIPNWQKHQRIDKPSASKWPAFEEGSKSPPRTLIEDSPLEGKGREGKGVEGTREARESHTPSVLDELTEVEDDTPVSPDPPKFGRKFGKPPEAVSLADAYHQRNCPPWAAAACAEGYCIPKYDWEQWEDRQKPRDAWLRSLQGFVEDVMRDEPPKPGDLMEKFWKRKMAKRFGTTEPPTASPPRPHVPTAAETRAALTYDRGDE
jgi:hypothetical protein